MYDECKFKFSQGKLYPKKNEVVLLYLGEKNSKPNRQWHCKLEKVFQ